jgi:hypothetical protein
MGAFDKLRAKFSGLGVKERDAAEPEPPRTASRASPSQAAPALLPSPHQQPLAYGSPLPARPPHGPPLFAASPMGAPSSNTLIAPRQQLLAEVAHKASQPGPSHRSPHNAPQHPGYAQAHQPVAGPVQQCIPYAQDDDEEDMRWVCGRASVVH